VRLGTIGILGAGEMGSAIARCLADNDMKVITSLDGRSSRSKKLAAEANMSDVGSLENLAANADIFLSIVPPALASSLAEQLCPIIEQSEKDVLYVDCNAVSPATVSKIASVAAGHGVRFQDAGIIGAAPRFDRSPVRFYTSGNWISDVKQLGGPLMEIKSLGPDIGRASAIKMVYASLTKGTHALRAAALMAGEKLGVGDEIRQEWAHSLPGVLEAMEKRIPLLAPVSGRWAGEMREIAETYASLGITPSFHEGAEWLYELLAGTSLAEESRDEAAQKQRSIEETLRYFTEALKDD
jgi:3-hydroxyisobutyrate dehydrogenase-like beta-hydroxyacid dehydrogenase